VVGGDIAACQWVRLADHWLYRLLAKRPNRYQNPYEWREMLQGHLALRGNAYNRIVDNGRGEILELVPIHPDRIRMELTPSGDYRYRVTDRLGVETILPRGEIWHLRGLSSDGLMGMSPIDLPSKAHRGILHHFSGCPMAIKSTIFKVELQLADLDREHFSDYGLTIARHPSETDERMMVRLLAFILHASPTLVFGRGLSTEDEADLWDIDPAGNIECWIDVGLPVERDIRRACNRSRKVVVISYGGRAADIWWRENAEKLATQSNLRVLALSSGEGQALARLVARTMRLQCTVQDGVIWLGNETQHIELRPTVLFSPNTP